MRAQSSSIVHRESVSIILVLVLCGIGYFAAISSQSAAEIALGDNAWYLNRAQVVWRGYFDDAFVYTILHPLILGGLDRLIGNLANAAIVLNVAIMCSTVFSTYQLGKLLFGHSTGIVAAITLCLNAGLPGIARILQPHLLFINMIVWCIIATVLLIQRRTIAQAVVLGLLVTIAMFTRFEGSVYTILFVVAGVAIYFNTRDWRRALTLFVICCITFVPSFIFYVRVFSSQITFSENTASSALLTFLTSNPFRFDILSNRLSDLLNYTLSYWPLWIWWLILAGVVWAPKQHRWQLWGLFGVILLNCGYIYVLSTWPVHTYVVHYVPYAALMFAYVLRVGFFPRWVGVALLILLFANFVPAYSNLIRSPLLSFQSSPVVGETETMDAWLRENGYSETEVYSLCPSVTPFSRSRLRLIYRLATNFHSPDNWNSPDQLIPHMRTNNELLLVCTDPVYFRDWKAFLEHPYNREQKIALIYESNGYQLFSAEKDAQP